MGLADRGQPPRERRGLMGGGVLTQVIAKLRWRRRDDAAPGRESIQVFLIGELGVGRGRGCNIVFGSEGACGFHGFIIYDKLFLSYIIYFLVHGNIGRSRTRSWSTDLWLSFENRLAQPFPDHLKKGRGPDQYAVPFGTPVVAVAGTSY